MWSVGCIIAEFINNIPIFPEHTDKDQLQAIFKVVGTPRQNLHEKLRTYKNWKMY